MATEGRVPELGAQESQPSQAMRRRLNSKEEQERHTREKVPPASGWGDLSEKGRGWQPPEDPRSLEGRLGAIRQTHGAIIDGIEAAQGNMVKMIQGEPILADIQNAVRKARYAALAQPRHEIWAQEVVEQAKKLQKSQKPPVEIQTLHRLLTTGLQAAEEEAKHFAALNKELSEKNAQLSTDNAILKQQNEMLMREKVIRQRQNEMKGCSVSICAEHKEPTSRVKTGRQPSPQISPEVSPRLPGPPLTPRTVAKVKAKIRQCSKTRDYERELKMRAEISRLQAICNKQKHEITILKGTDGRRAELELFLQQCLIDVKARVAGKRSSSTAIEGNEPPHLRHLRGNEVELPMAGRDQVLRKFLKLQQVIKLLHQIVTATNTVRDLDFSWLDDEAGDVELEQNPHAVSTHGGRKPSME